MMPTMTRSGSPVHVAAGTTAPRTAVGGGSGPRSFLRVVGALVVVVSVSLLLVPLLFGIRFAFVPTSSMEPNLAAGSLVVTRDISPPDIRVGDVVVFPQPGRPSQMIVHRVVAVQQDNLTTRGDANSRVDAWVLNVESVSGRTLFDVPYLGRLVDLLRSPAGVAMLVATGVALVAVGESKGRVRVPTAPLVSLEPATPISRDPAVLDLRDQVTPTSSDPALDTIAHALLTSIQWDAAGSDLYQKNSE